MSPRIHRRQMLRGAIASGAGLWLAASRIKADATSPNDKLNLALIGLGGRGADNLNSLASENIVALCDVDDHRAGNAYERFPQAKKFYDYREMLDRMNSQIDAVVISTPDHTHFHPAMAAMQMGKHLYCEKPMAHALGEVRAMTELAARKRLATQLGVQRHALSNVHRVVELIQSGAIGQVGECHAWVGGDRGMPKLPTDFPPVPEHLKWDLWLGPAADRPYSPAYVPYEWRFWWDFGTGETGNWGCHILDVPFWALGLRHPTKVSASGPPVDPRRTPTSMATRFEFPANADRPPVVLHWYHSKDGPDVLAQNKLPHFDMGVLFVGADGMLLCDFDKWRLYPEEKFADLRPPAETIPDSPGFHKEWLLACKGGPAETCNFDYSGPLSETTLLGNLAYRVGREFGWDAARLMAVGCPETEPHIHPTYRPGWTV
ncbi:MAG: Gfo/Idh/MocA family oxidoreductase [Planctomycetia bacterium]|nr:Gfo/Idh/MocA family oxidoreductase [Planctomycetia bacterium]